MCGICGYYGDNILLNSGKLREMNELIIHRGPDEDGYFYSDGVGLAMRRLSILDIEHGKQPIFNEDNTICTVFNGEIYNFKKLKKDLESKGHIFRTNSDTEVIVHLYEEYGKNLVQYLRGMFALAVWDSNKKSLLLARDRLGIKPLFYSIIENNVIFGSEIKCLLASNIVSNEIDLQAVDAFFTYTYIPSPLTIYKDIKKLEPGNLIIIDSSGVNKEQYWDLDFSKQGNSNTKQYWNKKIESTIYEAVKTHLLSDVPVGAFLSGGVDSSLIVAMMAKSSEQAIETFTMGFDDKSGALLDERKYAQLLVDKYNLIFNEFTVTPNYQKIIGEIVSAFDEPFADDSVIPSYYISKLTRKKVKVALSGLGGDELFAGYYRYLGLYVSQLYEYVPSFLNNYIVSPLINKLPEPKNSTDRINHIKRFINNSNKTPANRYLGYVSTLDSLERKKLFSSEVSDLIDYKKTNDIVLNAFNQCNSKSLTDKMLYTDIKTYLPDDILALSDRLSMWHSLELRVPFVDHKLVELCAKLPSRYKINLLGMKVILKKIARYWVPNEIIDHKKQGFESPMAGWIKNDLHTYINDLLSKENIEKIGIFNYQFIQDKLDAHFSGKEKNNKIIFSLMMFVLWYKNAYN